MTYSKLFVLLNVAFACTLAGCGSDDSGDDSGDDGSPGGSGGTTNTTGSSSGGAGGVGGSGGSSDGAGGSTDGGGSGGSTTGGSTTGGSTTGSGSGNPCSPTVGGGGSNDQCTDLGECIQQECESEYAECLGPNGANGDYSGGVCEDYMECASDCATGDECDFTCVVGCLEDADACQTCLDAANDCGEAACPDEYEECNASPTTATSTTGSTTGGGAGTCMDLEECCDSLDGELQEGCLTAVESAESDDDLCGVFLMSYQSANLCSP